MDLKLSPNFPQKTLFEGEGGSYKTWPSSDLANANVGGGKFVLKPRGFALPHYADSSKIGYVLQGTEGMVGMVLPNSSEEVVLRLKEGDIVPVPIGAISWWYNNGDSDFAMIFLGETSKAFVPGEFTYFLLSGSVGITGGFSSKFTSQAYNLNEKEAVKLAKSQTGMLIIKLQEGIQMPLINEFCIKKMIYNIDSASAEIEVQKGGVYKTLTPAKLPFIEKVGLSVSLVKLDANAMYSPTCTVDGSTRLVYVSKGSGHVQIVGINGKLVLDSKLEAGQLFVVPRFFTVAEVAGNDGMELLSITNSAWPTVKEFTTKESLWNVLSPVISQVALNVTPEFDEHFKSNIQKSSIIIPPPN